MQVTDPYQSQNRKSLTWLGAGAILLLLVAALGFTSGWLQLFGQPPTYATKLEAKPQPALLNDQADLPPPMLADEAKAMPKDIYDWLRHLERIERERRRLSTSQAAELSVAMTKMSLGGATDMLKGMMGGDENEDPPLPTEGLTASTAQKREEWTKLVDDFRSFPPPQECAAAASSYDESLTETRAMMMEVLEAMSTAQESPEKAVEALTNMQGKSSERIDAAGRDTDREVQIICDKYDTRKWFSISSDFAGGLMGGIPSLPGQ